MSVGAHLKSVLSLSYIALNLLVWSLPLLVLALAKLLLPAVRRPVDAVMDWIYGVAVVVDDVWLRHVLGIRWNRPALGLDPRESVIVLSNHASWSDILLIQSVIVRGGPVVKFLAKRELVFVPIFGLIFWAFDFPVLRRRSREGEDEAERRRRDFEALQEACRVVRRRPAALVNFAEGTRFSEGKRRARSSPYRTLLEPRAGGFSALLDALGDIAVRVVDLTIVYPSPVSFWAFLSGACREVRLEAEVFESANLPSTRSERAAWLAERWHAKDGRIDDVRREAS